MPNLKTLWQAAQVPLLGACIIVVIYTIWSFFDLPPREALIELFKGYIAEYGYFIVFVGAFIESLLVVGWYFPGSLVIFLSVILAPNPLAAVISVIVVTIALWSGYTLNFFIGKYGWYKLLIAFGVKQYLDEAQTKLTKYGVAAIFTSYWSPGLASFISTAAGILHYNPVKFLAFSLLAVTLWDIFWGALVYSLGERALTMFLSWPFMIFVLMLWIGARYWSEHKEKRV
jgi:membrane protein DedA with SNARE-associated domain